MLIADDHAAFRSFLHSKLQEWGFRSIVEVADGLEAVTKAAELQPDLVLLDIRMPKLNGLEAAAQIRLLAPQSRVVFVSLHADSDIVESALRDGASGYVLKARIEHELLPAIEAALQGKRFISPGLLPD